MIKAVIFDMDGVLVNSEKYVNIYWREAMKSFGYDMNYETALELRSLDSKLTEVKMRDIFGDDLDFIAVREERRRLMRNHVSNNGMESKPGAAEAIEKIKKSGMKVAIATSTEVKRANHYLTLAGLDGVFENIICSSMVKRGKPYPDVYLYTCDRMGIRPDECAAVEDSPNGVISAYDAGCKVIMVPDLTEPDDDLKKKLFAKIESLRDLPGVLGIE